MTLPRNSLDGFVSDDEVPVVELFNDDMVLKDSHGTATAVLDKSNYANNNQQSAKKRSSKNRGQQQQQQQRRQGNQYGSSPYQPPPGLFFQNHPSPTMMDNGPQTPKVIPPLFQFMGAVADKAKEFFSGPPVVSPSAASMDPPTPMSFGASKQYPRMYQGQQQQQPLPPYNEYNLPPPGVQPFPYNGGPQMQHFGQQQQQNGFMPQPFMEDHLDYFEKPPRHHKKKSKKHGSSSKKKSKKTTNSLFNFLGSSSSPSSSSTDGDNDADTVAMTLIPLLLLLAGGLVYMLTSENNRPTAIGPISTAVNKALSNLQMGSMIAITMGAAMLGYRIFGSSASSPLSSVFSNARDLTSSPASFMFAAGTSFAPSTSPSRTLMDQFLRIDANGPFVQNGGLPVGLPGGMPGGMPMGMPGGFPGQQVPGSMAPPMGMGMPGGFSYQGMPGGMPGGLPHGRIQELPLGFGMQYDDDDDEYDTDDEEEYLPAGAKGYKRAYGGKHHHNYNDSPLGNSPVKIDGLSREMLEEESKSSYYEDMPPLPGIGGNGLMDPSIFSALREGPDPELLALTSKKQKGAGKANKANKANANNANINANNAAPGKVDKNGQITENIYEKKSPKIAAAEERIKGTTRKKEKMYVDEFACKPYGPPPKRYRGVNV